MLDSDLIYFGLREGAWLCLDGVMLTNFLYLLLRKCFGCWEWDWASPGDVTATLGVGGGLG